ncbi:MAG: TonB-dependent receptor [Myxococcales bacterium]|nr:TonB-dependent receptor [Myxococcales bacterium]
MFAALYAPAAFAAEPAADVPGQPPDETVVVEAPAPRSPDPAATSAAVTVVRPDASTPASADVASLVESAAGTSVQRLGGLGDFTAVSIRGASLRQVEVFLDGVPLNPDGAGVVNLAELPVGAFERIEVWRGNAPVSFGAAPLGGVVNLVTRRGHGGALSAGYGSHQTVKGDAYGAVTRGALDGNAFVEVLASQADYRYFDDNATVFNVLDDHVRERANNDKLQVGGFVRGQAHLGDWHLSLTDAPLYRDEGLPGSINLPTEDARLTTVRNLAVVRAEGRGDVWAGSATVWHLGRRETLVDLDGELDGAARRETDLSDTVGLRVTATAAPRAWVQPSVTLGGHWEALDVTDTRATADEPVRSRLVGTAALGADLRVWNDRLTLSPVVQGVAIDGATTISSIDPRLGVLVRPTRWLSLKANGGRYLRAPDLVEMFGNHGNLEGNPRLVPERGWQGDLGARVEAPGTWPVVVSVDAGAFWLASEDRIVWVQNSQQSFTPVNFGETSVVGVEAALQVQGFDVVDSDTTVTWQQSRNLTADSGDFGNELPRTPPLTISEAVSMHWEERLRIGYSLSTTAANYWDAANLVRSAPRTLHGAFVRAQPTPRWPSLELSVLNLTDTLTEVVPRNPADADDPSRAVTAITDFAGYPLPGRTFLLTARWQPRPPTREQP